MMHLGKQEQQMQSEKQQAEYQKTLNEIKQNLSKDDKKLTNLLLKLEEKINNNSSSALNPNKNNKTSKKKEPSISQQNNEKIPLSDDQKETQKQISDIKELQQQIANHFDRLNSGNLGEYAQVSLFQNSAYTQLQVLNLCMKIEQLESKIAELEAKIDKLIGGDCDTNIQNALHDANSYFWHFFKLKMKELQLPDDFLGGTFYPYLKDPKYKDQLQLGINENSEIAKKKRNQLESILSIENLLKDLKIDDERNTILELADMNHTRNVKTHVYYNKIFKVFCFDDFEALDVEAIKNEKLKSLTIRVKKMMKNCRL